MTSNTPAPREVVSTLVAVALAIFFTIESPNFFTSDNALVLSQFIAPFALRGIVLIYSNGAPTNPIGSGTLANILGGWSWSEAFWALAVAALLHVMLRGTTFGLHILDAR